MLFKLFNRTTKDIVSFSGGENISVEIQVVLYAPEVADAAVVARPDEKWGETWGFPYRKNCKNEEMENV